MKKLTRIRIVNNAPVVLWFTVACAAALILSTATNGLSDRLVFSVYRSSLSDPLTYIRFFGHVIGHANIGHFMSNMMLLVVVGPMLEEKYGSKDLLTIMILTAFTTGLFHFIVFPGTMLLGASGIVFAFILLASFTQYKDGTLPITFIVVAVLYIGNQIYDGLFISDNVSNITHIIGGVIGTFFGLILNKKAN